MPPGYNLLKSNIRVLTMKAIPASAQLIPCMFTNESKVKCENTQKQNKS